MTGPNEQGSVLWVRQSNQSVCFRED